MKHIFILNSFTLKERLNTYEKRIKEYCQTNNVPYKIEVNSKEKSTDKILDEYKNNSDIIIAVGGDGIINRILNKIVNTKNVLGFIPLGTGNDFYKTIKEEKLDYITPVDIVSINDKYFINIACFGIDADIANHKNGGDGIIPKQYKYKVSLLKEFFKYKKRHFKVILPDETYEDNYTTIAVCKGKYYGNGFKVSPLSKLDNGLLDIYLAPNISKLKMINLLLKMKKSKHVSDKSLIYKRTSNITIKSETPITCNIDGEELTSKEFKIKVINKGIKVYYNETLINYIIKGK